MHFKRGYSDYDDSESLSRTGKVQRRIATALIRPTSTSTGEQRFLLQPHTDWRGHISPNTFAESIESDKSTAETRDKQLLGAMQSVEEIDNILRGQDVQIAQARQQNPEQLSQLQYSRDMTNAWRDQAEEQIRRLGPAPKPSQTSRHTTLAALLGKHAVGYALSDENPAMSGETKNLGENSPYYETEDGPGHIFTASGLGQAKATHRANTRTLSRGRRLMARIAPYHVVVHELGDAYGGREEGGWVYETGTPVHTSRGFVTQRGAAKEADRLRAQYPRKQRNILNMSASDVYEMDADQGVFEPLTYTDNYAKAYGLPSTFIQEPLDEDYDYSHFGQSSQDYQVRVGYGKIGEYPKRKPRYE